MGRAVLVQDRRELQRRFFDSVPGIARGRIACACLVGGAWTY